MGIGKALSTLFNANYNAKVTRRNFLVGGALVLLAGCKGKKGKKLREMPPEDAGKPRVRPQPVPALPVPKLGGIDLARISSSTLDMTGYGMQRLLIIEGEHALQLFRNKKEVIIEHSTVKDRGRPGYAFDNVYKHEEIKISKDSYTTSYFDSAYMTGRLNLISGLKLSSRKHKGAYKEQIKLQINLIDQLLQVSYKFRTKERAYLKELKKQLKGYL